MKLLRKVRAIFRREKVDREMDAEMRAHLDLQTERNIATGMGADEARFAALRQFGNVASLQERAREQRGWVWLEQFGKDLRLAARSLWRSPGFAATALLTFVFGIGAATAVFSVVHALLLAPLQYRDAGQLVQLQARHLERGISGLAPATFGDIAATNVSFATVAAQYYYYVNLTGTDTPTLVNSADVTSEYFKLFDVAALRGRTWQPQDLLPGAAPVVVLGHALWRSHFNSRDSIIGEQVLLDDVAYTVIGVMPSSFKDPSEIAQLWRPMREGADNLLDRSGHYWNGFGRLKPGVTLKTANTELATLGSQLERAHPKEYEEWTLQAADLRNAVVGDYRAGLFIVLGAVGCVVLITCANVTGLSIVRATARRKELAIRTALGSSRGQLLRLLLTENLLLAALGGSGGVLLAYWGLDVLLASLPEGWLPRADEVALSLPVLGATAGIAVLTGVISGFVPGFTAFRIDANDALKDSSRGSTGASSRRLRASLIVAEIALALILLAATGLLGRSFFGLMRKPSGLDAERVLSLTVSLSANRYESAARSLDFFSRAETEVSAVPGVEAAGFTHTSPFRWGIPVAFGPVHAGDVAAMENLPPAFTDSVSIDYFRAIGIPLRSGRRFTLADDSKAPPRVILSESAARRYFGTEDPIGRSVAGGPEPGGRFEVVGVVGDVPRSGMTADTPLQVYRPLAQRTPPFATLMVRTSLPPASLAKSVQAALWRIDPDIPVSDVATMDMFVRRSVAQPRLYFALFSLFAALAVLLACIGLYGLIAYSVAQRTREFGIRAALGARPREVLMLVVREGLLLVALGVGLGLAVSFAAAGLLERMIFSISPHDPAVFLGMPLVLALVAAVACLLPAWRATKVDPMTALRVE
ncbi:MAG TPA: ABC transporter permease [Opitutaceae bacterium]|nr:ABC transporter permease [Opitutaceae bacterium]